LAFNGDNEYLEDVLARIDVPLLDDLTISFFHQLIFDTPQLTRLISRTPKFNGHDKAHVDFTDGGVSVTLRQTPNRKLCLGTSYNDLDPQISSLAQVCGSFFPQALIHAVEHLYITGESGLLLLPPWLQDTAENSQWLDLLRPFSTVKCLYMSQTFAPRIAPVLEELVGDRATEALPVLQTLFLDRADLSGPVWEVIGRFVAARQLAGHPIAVSSWENKPFE
jgi:hypothetical protein